MALLPAMRSFFGTANLQMASITLLGLNGLHGCLLVVMDGVV